MTVRRIASTSVFFAGFLFVAACGSSSADDVTINTDFATTVAGVPSSSLGPINADSESVDAATCAKSLTAFSAVSNILMSGLAKPSSFETDRYKRNLEITRLIAVGPIDTDFSVYFDGYSAAGDALDTAQKAGAGTRQGAQALDEATAILNDLSVTRAAQRVASFLANDCVGRAS